VWESARRLWGCCRRRCVCARRVELLRHRDGTAALLVAACCWCDACRRPCALFLATGRVFENAYVTNELASAGRWHSCHAQWRRSCVTFCVCSWLSRNCRVAASWQGCPAARCSWLWLPQPTR
jgi:hypothetical protein